MNYLKTIYKPLLYLFSTILILNLIITIFSFFNIFSCNITIYLKFITGIVAFIIGGYKIGQKSLKKGYLEGIKLGLIGIIIMIILSIIFKGFKYRSFIYYIVLIISSVIGSMIGINKKNKE